jgi:DNA-directed RNA polymerase specialized sigma24 family protein
VAVTPDWPDSELILRSRAEPALFAGIFDRHYGELHRYLRRRIGTGPAADLAAETFVTAFTRRGAYRAQGPDARPWLYGIAHNLLRNYVRHEHRRLAAYARRGWPWPAWPRVTATYCCFSPGPTCRMRR